MTLQVITKKTLLLVFVYLKVWVFVFVHTGWHVHGPALHFSSVQFQRFRDRQRAFKLHIPVAFEGPFVAEDGANLFDGATGLKQCPEFCLWLLQGVRQVAYEHAAVIISELELIVTLPLVGGLLGFFHSRWSRLIAGGSTPPRLSRLRLHVLLCSLVTIASVPLGT